MAARGTTVLAWDHWHIEPSSVCSLRCPRCPRAEVPDSLLNRQLTLRFFQQQLGEDVINKIGKITLCGNDGDPIYCRELIDICGWIKSINPQLHLVIITNGSYRTEHWWGSLAEVLDSKDELHWSLDGWDQISNSQYRINCDWTSIMQGIKAFTASNSSTYRVWAAIAFRFNQHRLDHMRGMADELGMDLWQLTRSTKFGSHYPDTYGRDDPLCPDRPELVSTSHRFQRDLHALTTRARPADHMKNIFLQRAHDLAATGQYPALCQIGNKGVFLDSQGRFYPCCWTANRYQHNQGWHALAARQFDLNRISFVELLKDRFWSQDFLKFDSVECRTKCTPEQLKISEHVTEW